MKRVDLTGDTAKITDELKALIEETKNLSVKNLEMFQHETIENTKQNAEQLQEWVHGQDVGSEIGETKEVLLESEIWTSIDELSLVYESVDSFLSFFALFWMILVISWVFSRKKPLSRF